MSWLRRLLEEKIGEGREPSITRFLLLVLGGATVGVGIAAFVVGVTTTLVTIPFVLDWWAKIFLGSVGAYIGGQVGKGMADSARR